MTTEELAELLQNVLLDAAECDEDELAEVGFPREVTELDRVQTFGEVGMLSGNAGLVVTLADGSEYQLQIVQSKRADS